MNKIVVTFDTGLTGFNGILMLLFTATTGRFYRGLLVAFATGGAVIVKEPVTNVICQSGPLSIPDIGVIIITADLPPYITDTVNNMSIGCCSQAPWKVASLLS